MTLSALLSAQMPSIDGAGSGLAALLPVAGLTLIERQAQDAAAVGVSHLLVLVDAVPPELTAAVDRIRARGLQVTMVRDGAAVIAASADGGSRLMLVADGLVAPRALWDAVAGTAAPRMLAVSDTPATAALERIDAQRRWAGLAVVDADAVTALAGLPSDWDPQLALLRAAIQSNAPSIPCEPQLFERGDIAMLDRAVAAELVEQRLLTKDTDAVAGLLHANVAMPIARICARWLLKGQYGGLAARTAAAVAAAGAGVAIFWGWPAVAVFAALIGVLAKASATIVAAFRPETSGLRNLGIGGEVLFAAAAICAAWAAGNSAPGHLPVWLAVGLTIVLLIQAGRMLTERSAIMPGLLWDDGALWLAIGVGLALGAWPWALAAAAPLAAASIVLAIWRGRDRTTV